MPHYPHTLYDLLSCLPRLPPLALGGFVGRVRADLADALGHMHGREVIHGDVKPGNICFDGEKRLRLIDYGLATPKGTR